VKAKTPTLKIGTSNSRAFTFIELILVLFILSASLLWVTPKLLSFQIQDIQWTARHMAGWIRRMAAESSIAHKTYRLYYDLEAGQYWAAVLQENGEYVTAVDPLTRKWTLPAGVAFEDIVTARQGQVSTGETFMQVHPFGVEKAWIHLRSEEGVWSLEVHPLTGRVRVFDQYIASTTPAGLESRAPAPPEF